MEQAFNNEFQKFQTELAALLSNQQNATLAILKSTQDEINNINSNTLQKITGLSINLGQELSTIIDNLLGSITTGKTGTSKIPFFEDLF